jgi:hypothetical protein
MDQVSGRFTPGAFDLEGLSLTGYTLFAFALGVLAGLLLRRTVPAIVVAFVAVRLPVEYWLRQRYQSPVTLLLDPTGNHTMGPGTIPTSPGPRGWTLSQDLVDKTGHLLSSAQNDQITQKLGTLPNPAAIDAYLHGARAAPQGRLPARRPILELPETDRSVVPNGPSPDRLSGSATGGWPGKDRRPRRTPVN